ncbi:hypothetical protein N7493_008686 [Penicillium malachiteum]|uniref:Mannosyltransferase 1, CMT1 n=1 Tax=Penicillium malachiteum TaxID=1324776 RepID=A0AAD6MSR0_9EURO|nr:hypothetical protein N7493_008686 [Penicillium malachiteum]
MSSRPLHPEYELAARDSLDAEGIFNLDDADFEAQVPLGSRSRPHQYRWLPRMFSSTWSGYHRLKSKSRPVLVKSTRRPSCLPRLFRRRCCYLHLILAFLFALLFLTSIVCPSYTHPPSHYYSLRFLARNTTEAGRGNLRNEKVFIAASLYDRDGELAGGHWGAQLLELIHLLGEQNVFVSIYENDGGVEGKRALRELEKQITSRKSIVFEEHLDLKTVPTVVIPGGEKRVKRIEYLAQVRNKALQPLNDDPHTRYDKLLYLNDVLFDPVDALQLLFSTNANKIGMAEYRAACAVDFANPFKFYDTYATRDLEGFGMGVPFYPWFSTAGSGESRKDVLQGKDAVRVRSCWGGMVAFDAKYFQTKLPDRSSPARFRSGDDLFWEASECCLIHADIQDPQSYLNNVVDTGIYMNPYVRVAYDYRTLSWLGITRRFEKLYPLVHNIVNHLVGMPWLNPRRTEGPGQRVHEVVWIPDERHSGGGSFQSVDRIAGNDGYCGRRGLQVILENREPGQKGYEDIPVPSA